MSDDDTRRLPAVSPTSEDQHDEAPTPDADATAQGAGAPTGTTARAGTAPTAPLPAPDDPSPTAPLSPTDSVPDDPPGHIRVTTPMAPAAGTVPQPRPRPTPRVATVVWGVMVVAVGVGLLSTAWGAHLDTELAFIVLLGVAGVALLVGSLAGMRRSRNRMEGRD